jgi:hypothetical protein
MKINLKDYAKETAFLKHVEKVLANQSETKGLSRTIRSLIIEREEIETDLELGGECILELDKERLEAIKERNKMLVFTNKEENY